MGVDDDLDIWASPSRRWQHRFGLRSPRGLLCRVNRGDWSCVVLRPRRQCCPGGEVPWWIRAGGSRENNTDAVAFLWIVSLPLKARGAAGPGRAGAFPFDAKTSSAAGGESNPFFGGAVALISSKSGSGRTLGRSECDRVFGVTKSCSRGVAGQLRGPSWHGNFSFVELREFYEQDENGERRSSSKPPFLSEEARLLGGIGHARSAPFRH